ncbi:MAG: NAD(+) synthase [Flavobacteriales bacterium]
MQVVAAHITNWLKSYQSKAQAKGFVVGVSGGIDSALTATLCALTGSKTILVNMPIRQTQAELNRALEQMNTLKNNYNNVVLQEIDLTPSFNVLEATLGLDPAQHHLSLANTRARLRMTTLYALAQANGCLVAGTGNKVEDFGVGFYTKYGDGGVDISPIADLYKTEVFKLAKELQVVQCILDAKPTDGLWEDGRSDEDQIGATYPELEWAMQHDGSTEGLTPRQLEVLHIYTRLNQANQHKMQPIPVCAIPLELKATLK